jgi:hypothetical protein
VVALEAIRRFATEFPEVQESAHFRFQQPIFKVGGKVFAGVDRWDVSAVFSISNAEAAAIVAKDPATYEEVWRPGATKSFVGVRVDLARVSEERVRELIERAWRTKAPRRLLGAYDAQRL